MKLRSDEKKASATRAEAYISLTGYATILALTREPITAAEVVSRTQIGENSARRLLKQFHAQRLVHRVGWVRPSVKGIDQPVYQFGDGPDVPARLTKKSGKRMPHADFVPPMTKRVKTFVDVIRAMEAPSTLNQISNEAGLTVSRLTILLRHLRRPDVALAHIAGWNEIDGAGRGVRQFLFGAGRDVPRPRKQRQRQRQERKRVLNDIQRPQWHQVVMQLNRDAGFQYGRVGNPRA